MDKEARFTLRVHTGKRNLFKVSKAPHADELHGYILCVGHYRFTLRWAAGPSYRTARNRRYLQQVAEQVPNVPIVIMTTEADVELWRLADLNITVVTLDEFKLIADNKNAVVIIDRIAGADHDEARRQTNYHEDVFYVVNFILMRRRVRIGEPLYNRNFTRKQP